MAMPARQKIRSRAVKPGINRLTSANTNRNTSPVKRMGRSRVRSALVK